MMEIPIEKFISDWIDGQCRKFAAEIEEAMEEELYEPECCMIHESYTESCLYGTEGCVREHSIVEFHIYEDDLYEVIQGGEMTDFGFLPLPDEDEDNGVTP